MIARLASSATPRAAMASKTRARSGIVKLAVEASHRWSSAWTTSAIAATRGAMASGRGSRPTVDACRSAMRDAAPSAAATARPASGSDREPPGTTPASTTAAHTPWPTVRTWMTRRPRTSRGTISITAATAMVELAMAATMAVFGGTTPVAHAISASRCPASAIHRASEIAEVGPLGSIVARKLTDPERAQATSPGARVPGHSRARTAHPGRPNRGSQRGPRPARDAANTARLIKDGATQAAS
jgi:hypothetical protein